MYDAIIIGGRCAGAATGMLLARRGMKVLVTDRATFPSDTVSTHWLQPPAVAKLREWGVLDRVLATGCPVVRRLRFDVGPFALEGEPAPVPGADFAIAPRRTVLDAILVEAARAAGAEVREGFRVHELMQEGERVTGIRGGSGSTVVEHADIVIGADGRHSLVAASVGAPEYDVELARACYYYSYWSGVPTEMGELYARDGMGAGVWPTNDGLTLVIVGWPVARFSEVRSNIEASYHAALAAISPDLAGRVAAGTREHAFMGTADLRGFYRRPYGDGWALVGDAGHHKDPITAQGMSDAFRDAETLAAAIVDGFEGRRPLQERLAAYEQERNEQTRPLYALTTELAEMKPPPSELQQVFAALRDNPADTSRFLGVISGTVPVPAFFAPENLQRIVGGVPV